MFFKDKKCLHVKCSASDRFCIKLRSFSEERATESLLLKEQRNLIASGIDKRFIKIRRNRIYKCHSQHGEVTNGVFQLTGPSTKQANTNLVTQDTQNTTSNAPPSISCESNSTSPVSEEETCAYFYDEKKKLMN